MRCATLQGEIAVTGDNRGNVIFWETLAGKCLGEVRVEAPAVLDLAIDRAGATVAAESRYPAPYVSIIDVGRRVELNRIPQEEVIRAVTLSGDGKPRLGREELWPCDTRRSDWQSCTGVAGHVGGCSSLAFNADASGSCQAGSAVVRPFGGS